MSDPIEGASATETVSEPATDDVGQATTVEDTTPTPGTPEASPQAGTEESFFRSVQLGRQSPPCV